MEELKDNSLKRTDGICQLKRKKNKQQGDQAPPVLNAATLQRDLLLHKWTNHSKNHSRNEEALPVIHASGKKIQHNA